MARPGVGVGSLLVAFAAGLVAGGVAGCGTGPGEGAPAKPDRLILGGSRVEIAGVTPEVITRHVTVGRADDGGTVTYRGPAIEASYQPLVRKDGTLYRNERPKYGGLPWHMLRSWREAAGGRVRHELYVAYSYSAPLAWQLDKARFDDASVVPVAVFDRALAKCLAKRCVRVEHLGVPVTDEYLRLRRKTGFRVRLFSLRGHSAVLTVPANYVEGYLSAVEGKVAAP